jgi:hypothetical protein
MLEYGTDDGLLRSNPGIVDLERSPAREGSA